MTDPNKLLAAYATNTLTEEERPQLFHAALRNQALFDALADEDALRELLADPQARAQILAALAEPAPVKVIPFYRRMPVLGAAASLILAVTAGLAYWRTQGTEPLRPAVVPRPAAPAEAPMMELRAPVSPSPKPELHRKQKAEPMEQPAADAVGVTWGLRKERVDKETKPTPEPPAPMPSSVPAAAAPAPVTTGVATGAAKESEDRARGVVGGVVGGVVASRAKAEKKAAPPAGLSAAQAGAGPSASQNNYAQQNQINQIANLADLTTDASQSPTWTLESLEDGRARLRVLWTSGHLYLLLREGETVSLPKPASEAVAQGRHETIFLLPKGGALDLYLLPEAVTEPAKLPAEGPLRGFRHRLRKAN